MVFLENYHDFADQAEAIFIANPQKTRYVINYHHSKGQLVLKVTDDVRTVQFKTDQQSDLRKVKSLIASEDHCFLRVSCNMVQ